LYFDSVDKGAELFSLAIQCIVCLSLGSNSRTGYCTLEKTEYTPFEQTF